MKDQRPGVVLGVLAACALTLTFLGGEVRATTYWGPGDANGDDVVNQADLDIVLNDYNQVFTGNTWGYGDFNNDGIVNGADLDVVLSNMGKGGTSVAAAVPEPATLALLATGLLGLLAYGWRKRR